jgi:hypothetical protein
MEVSKAVAHFAHGKAHLEFTQPAAGSVRGLAWRLIVRLVRASGEADRFDNVVKGARSDDNRRRDQSTTKTRAFSWSRLRGLGMFTKARASSLSGPEEDK